MLSQYFILIILIDFTEGKAHGHTHKSRKSGCSLPFLSLTLLVLVAKRVEAIGYMLTPNPHSLLASSMSLNF